MAGIVLAVGNAQDLVQAALSIEGTLHALFPQRPPALFAELVAQLVGGRALMDHAAQLRRHLHHLVNAEAPLEAAVVTRLAAGPFAEGAVGFVEDAGVAELDL